MRFNNKEVIKTTWYNLICKTYKSLVRQNTTLRVVKQLRTTAINWTNVIANKL